MSAPQAVAHRAAVFAALEGLSLLVGFLMQPLLMRTLGLDNYGSYALACALGVLAYTLTDFGANLAAVTRGIELAPDSSAAHRHVWAVQGVKALAGGAIVLAGLAWAMVSHTPQAQVNAIAMTIGAASAWSFPMWFLFSRQKVLTIAASLLAARVLCLGAAVLVVAGPAQLPWALLFTLGAPLLGALIVLGDPDVRAHVRPCLPSNCELRAAAKDGLAMLWLSGHGVMSAAVFQSLLFALTSSATLGLFAAADRVRAGVQGLFTAFGSAVFPHFVQRRVGVGVDKEEEVWALLRLQVTVAAVVALALIGLAPDIVRIVLGTEFSDAAHVLRVLSLALVTTTLLAGLGLQVMLPRRLGRYYTAATLAVLLVQCMALLAFAPGLSEVAAAVAVVASEGAVALILCALMWRRRRA